MPEFDIDAALAAPAPAEPGYSYKWGIGIYVAVEEGCPLATLNTICEHMSGIEAAVIRRMVDGVRGKVGRVVWDRDDLLADELSLTCEIQVSSQHDPLTAVQAADMAQALWEQEVVRRLTPDQSYVLDEPRSEYWEDYNA